MARPGLPPAALPVPGVRQHPGPEEGPTGSPGSGPPAPRRSPGVPVKTAAFTVRATEKQSIRWKRAADGEGHRAVGTWLAEAADRYLEAVARAGKLVAMGWRRCAAFSVRLPDREEMATVRGWPSHPFAFYRGPYAGP